MVSMKMTAAEKKKSGPEVAMPSKMEGPEYPYGLSIELNQESLDKLGIKLPAVGDELDLSAAVKVVSCHASENEGGSKYASCRLQITDMEIKGESSVSAIAKRLYKKED